jgi:hypothetical protein
VALPGHVGLGGLIAPGLDFGKRPIAIRTRRSVRVRAVGQLEATENAISTRARVPGEARLLAIEIEG